MSEKNQTYIFINAWNAPADNEGHSAIMMAFAQIIAAELLHGLVEPHCIIGLGPATRGADPLGSMSPFILVEDEDGKNFFVKKDDIPA